MAYSANEVTFLYSLSLGDLNGTHLKMNESSIYVCAAFNYNIITCD